MPFMRVWYSEVRKWSDTRTIRRAKTTLIWDCHPAFFTKIVVEKLAVWDEYESDYTAFDVCGIEVRVLDDDLAEAIKYLSEKDREILLMYFFLGMSDTEIGDRLKINRSTSFRSRKNSLEEIKKKLKENMNDE